MPPDTLATLLSLLPGFLAAGAAYGGVKVGLNGARQSIKSIENIVSRLDEKVDNHGERITAIEVETINIKERIDNEF